MYDRLAELVLAASHHADLRQPAPHRREGRAPPRRAARRGARHRAPRQPRARASAASRAAAEAGRSSRRWWPPARWSSASTSATSTWCASSARRARSTPSCSASAAPATPSARCPKGRLFPLALDDLLECAALARRGGPWRARPHPRAGQAAGRAGAAHRRRNGLPRMAARCAVRMLPARAAVSRPHAAGVRAGRADAGRRLQPPAAAGAAPTCTTTPSTACCGRAAARGWPPSPMRA